MSWFKESPRSQIMHTTNRMLARRKRFHSHGWIADCINERGDVIVDLGTFATHAEAITAAQAYAAQRKEEINVDTLREQIADRGYKGRHRLEPFDVRGTDQIWLGSDGRWCRFISGTATQKQRLEYLT